MREMRGWRPSLSAAVQAFIYFPSQPPYADAALLKCGACYCSCTTVQQKPAGQLLNKLVHFLAGLCTVSETAPGNATADATVFMFAGLFRPTHQSQLSVNPDSARRLDGMKHLRNLEWEMSRFCGA